MSTVVISLGGSVLVPNGPDITFISLIAAELKRLAQKHRLFIVVGGGKTARSYINGARRLGADECFLDDIGIAVTRINAMMLTAALGDSAAPKPALTFDDALGAGAAAPIVVMGGTHPGHTTDAVAAMLAERAGADTLVIMTSVDGVYTADPKKDPSAEKLEKLSAKRLIEIVSQSAAGAGSSNVIDLVAAQIIARSKIPACVIEGTDIAALKNAINKKKFAGSTITG